MKAGGWEEATPQCRRKREVWLPRRPGLSLDSHWVFLALVLFWDLHPSPKCWVHPGKSHLCVILSSHRDCGQVSCLSLGLVTSRSMLGRRLLHAQTEGTGYKPPAHHQRLALLVSFTQR